MMFSKKNILLTTLLSLSFAAAPAFAVKTGEEAPQFKLRGADGQMYDLAQYRDNKIVVLEWTNHGCPFVKKHYNSEAKNMQTLQERYTNKKDVVWFSINSTKEGNKDYVNADAALKEAKEYGAKPTAILLDADGTVGKMYDAKTTPHMFVIDKKGTLVYQGAIDDKPTTDVADIKGAKNYVASALDHLLDKKTSGKPLAVGSTKPYGCSVKY